jgi:hypothetical protein
MTKEYVEKAEAPQFSAVGLGRAKKPAKQAP